MATIVSVVFDDKRKVPKVDCKDKSLTQQSFRDECDINKIMAQFDKTGSVSHINERQAIYGDVSSLPDYLGAVLIVKQSEEAFMTLPVEIRNRFENDPAKLIEFLEDERNREEAVKLGIIEDSKGGGDKVPPVEIPPLESNPSASGGATK